MNNIWLLYPRTNRIRVALIVSGFVLDGKHIEVFDENQKNYTGKSQNILLSKTFRPQCDSTPSCGHGLSQGVSSTQTEVNGNLRQGAFRWGGDRPAAQSILVKRTRYQHPSAGTYIV